MARRPFGSNRRWTGHGACTVNPRLIKRLLDRRRRMPICDEEPGQGHKWVAAVVGRLVEHDTEQPLGLART
jgi:hypothetical protein